MSASCSYCGASLNFGLKFCVVCGRQTIAALNKMGGIKSGVRQGDSTRRLADTKEAQTYRSKKRSLRFRKSIRTLSQTIFYGFIAGALFFCAARVTLQALYPGRVNRMVAPIFEQFPIDTPKLVQIAGNAAKFFSGNKAPPAKQKKTSSKKGRQRIQ